MKSVVTGGAGFIGSHLVDRLLEIGHEVLVIDNMSAECNNAFYFNDSAKNFSYDICDYKNTRWLYNDADYVFHLAAESRLQPSIKNPVQTMMKNVVGTSTVLQCAREAGVKTVVYSSTSSGYGNNEIPNIEAQPDDCLNPYSVSKVAAEKICKMYTDMYGLKTISLRYFNVYGDRSPSKGQYALVIGIFMRQLNENKPLTIVGDGSQRRDFVYVGDVVSANIMSATRQLEDNCYGQVYNIGSGTNVSVKEIADSISDNHTYIPSRIGEMHSTMADISKAREVLGWEPSISVIEWIRKRHDN